jgi:hypothetical protein
METYGEWRFAQWVEASGQSHAMDALPPGERVDTIFLKCISRK